MKSGIYKHYESKEAIWNALLDEMIAYYDERFGSSEHLPPVPDSLEGLVAMTMQMVDFTIHDENVIKTRKLLTIEQFRDLETRPDSPGEPGMQPRDPCLPWRGKLGPGHTLR